MKTWSVGEVLRSVDLNANFAECVSTSTPKTVTAAHTWTASQAFSGGATFGAATTVSTGGLTVTAGGLTVTAGGLTVTAGGLTVSAGTTAVQALTATTGTFSSTGTFTSTGTSIATSGDIVVAATKRFYLDGSGGVGGNTYMYEATDNNIAIITNGLQRMAITNGDTFILNGALSTDSVKFVNVPSAPVNGEVWFDGTNLRVRSGGVTYTLTKT